MKNLILSLLLMLSSILISFGQTENPFSKGMLLSGGSFSFDFDQIKDYEPISGTNPQQITTTKSKVFNTDLHLGYFILNQFVIGFNTDIQVTHDKVSFTLIPDEIKLINDRIFVGPFFRYYTKAGLFFEGGTAIAFNEHGWEDDNNKWKEYCIDTGIGYNLFIFKSVALEPQLKYKYFNTPNKISENYKEIINGLSLAVGLQLFINPKGDQNK